MLQIVLHRAAQDNPKQPKAASPNKGLITSHGASPARGGPMGARDSVANSMGSIPDAADNKQSSIMTSATVAQMQNSAHINVESDENKNIRQIY